MTWSQTREASDCSLHGRKAVSVVAVRGHVPTLCLEVLQSRFSPQRQSSPWCERKETRQPYQSALLSPRDDKTLLRACGRPLMSTEVFPPFPQRESMAVQTRVRLQTAVSTAAATQCLWWSADTAAGSAQLPVSGFLCHTLVSGDFSMPFRAILSESACTCSREKWVKGLTHSLVICGSAGGVGPLMSIILYDQISL